MNAPYYNGPPGDDDPEGEAHQQCPGCSARDGERCDLDCTCGACERVDEDGPRGDEAAAHASVHLGGGEWQMRIGACRHCAMTEQRRTRAIADAWLKWDAQRGWIEWDWQRNRADDAGNRSAA